MKIWIPGGDGLVGKTLQTICKTQGISFLATTRADADISDLTQIEHVLHASEGITHIINCAAYAHVDKAQLQPDEAFKSNVLGIQNLGIMARLKKLKIVHISTDYLFGSEKNTPFQEQDPCCPCSVYAKTKHEGELRLLEEFPHACIVRTSWVFGRGGNNLISSLWDKLHQEKKIQIVQDQVSRLTYAKDLADILLALLAHEGIYHFANEGITSRYEVAKYMQQLLQEKGDPISCQEIEPISITTFPTVAPRPRFSVLDTQKIATVVGIIPRPWQIALKEYVDAKNT